MYHVSTDNRFPYRVYGAQQDSGAVALPSAASGNDGITMEQFKEVTAGGESGMIAPDPKDPDIVYGGGVERLDLRTEQTHSVDPTLAEPDDLYRRTWTLPLVFSKRDPKALYYANQKHVPHERRRPALDGDQPRPDARGSRRCPPTSMRSPRPTTSAPGRAAA